MTSKVDRRRFLRKAGTGVVAGVAASAGVAALAADAAPPLPDANTAKPAVRTNTPAVCCSPATKLVFPCSGSADVGEIADHAARKLSADGMCKMSCLAGIGGRVKNLLEIAQWKRLDRVWALVGNKPGYASYLRDEISQMVGTAEPQPTLASSADETGAKESVGSPVNKPEPPPVDLPIPQ